MSLSVFLLIIAAAFVLWLFGYVSGRAVLASILLFIIVAAAQILFGYRKKA